MWAGPFTIKREEKRHESESITQGSVPGLAVSTLGVTAFDSDENLIKGESKLISARAKVGKSIGVQVRYEGAVFVKTNYYVLSLIHESQSFSSLSGQTDIDLGIA